MSVPKELSYNRTHEWARADGDVVVMGITHYAQDQLGEVVYVELPDIGTGADSGAELGTLESVKAVAEFVAPAAGEVTEVNERLADEPNLVNEDPYGDGWLVKLTGSLSEDLLDAAGYQKLIEEEKRLMHPWIGASETDRRQILDELGIGSIDDLFATVPEEVRIDGLDLPTAQDEETVRRALGTLAAGNVAMDSRPSFLGAGVYRHVQPTVVDSVLSRAEFFTSYTPYQPEISQGTLQVIFEFQTLICQLTGCEVSNASLYDGATALVEAVLFSHRVLRGKRKRVVIAETVHPMYRRVLDTYALAEGIEVVVVPPSADNGRVDPDRLRGSAGDEAACVAIQSPNFLGVVEDLPAIAEAAHAGGALAVEVITEAVSLGLLAGGGEFGFDVVCGEAQSFGVAPGFGGPHLGFFACAAKNIRQMPGRLAGETVDEAGDRAFCLTLSTREQHIRRAKATSNICTNQGLMALAATVWLESIGGSGLRELATLCLAKSEELKRRIAEVGGKWRLAHPAGPTFNEFLVLGPGSGTELAARLAEESILGGVPSSLWGGSWPDGLLVAATECATAADIEAFVDAIGRLQ